MRRWPDSWTLKRNHERHFRKESEIASTLQSRLESSEQTCNREIDAAIIVSELSELRLEAKDSRHEVDETRNRLQRRASIYESEMLALRDDLVKARALKSKSVREAKARHEAELIRLRVVQC